MRLDGVRVHIGAFRILRGVNLEVPDGEVVALVGRNGAGKTTTIKSILGLVPVDAGTITLEDRRLEQVPPHRRARLGIGYVPEDRRLIGALTVEENVLLPAWANGLPDAAERLAWIYQLIPEARELARRRATVLSGGQQKLVALARALMTGRRLLLLDEPFAGLAPALAQRLGNAVRDLRGEGLSVLLAESELGLIGQLADRVYTIERGEIVGQNEAPSHLGGAARPRSED